MAASALGTAMASATAAATAAADNEPMSRIAGMCRRKLLRHCNLGTQQVPLSLSRCNAEMLQLLENGRLEWKKLPANAGRIAILG
eukprot:CAMPEP_0176128778 /NCGR_PEP_ID=MMETSP0120_2-20121206/65086_1 /TAXON_ID=160619 /ORGANISM="Kryptoperidinium foliaceum, Strain CCMP 1326" /LENGTH=84 /DNA_ID=CAMNT_0017463905 /DNA_START=85 /DNA_END=335 /DNA_ORIENTATION=+